MLSFRKKVILSDIALFLVFIFLLFPFVERTVSNIMHSSLERRADALITMLKKSSSLPGMIGLMESDEQFFFQRATLFDADGNVLYDSHIQGSGKSVAREEELDHSPEIELALQEGRGYSESYSEMFHETFAYVAISFKANGQRYVLRSGFPYDEIREMTVAFEKGFLLLGFVVLLLYSIMAWAVTHRLTRPIQQIINTISPYQEGKEELLPKIVLPPSNPRDEFNKLASTLNSLSSKIQRQIEQSVQKSREIEGILESLSEGVIALDTQARVTFANDTACRFIGGGQAFILGKRLDELEMRKDELCRKGHELVIQVLQTSEPVVKLEFGAFFEFAGGHRAKMVLDLIAAPLAHQRGAILVLQDKTSDYKMVEMGKDFIANASHELKTPITIIRGFAETLGDMPNLSKQQQHEIIEKIVRTCGRLDKLVKSLLTLSDIENLAEERFYTADLVTITENCACMLQSIHQGIEVTLDADVASVVIFADPDLIDLAIMNVLENAVKYSPSPAKIHLRLWRKGAHACLDIHDEGIGIPEQDLPHIFNRFYTVDKARSRKSGGSGLGLSIVKTIIEKHRGTVAVSSEIAKGSSFTLSLPLA